MVKIKKAIKRAITKAAYLAGFGYKVQVRTEWGMEFSHFSLTFQDALSWSSCYPAADLVWITSGWGKILIAARVESRPAPWIVS